MIQQFKTLSLAAAAAFFLAGPAQAHFAGTTAYRTTFYSDSSKTTEIGHIQPWGGCTYDEVTDTDFVNYRLFGSTSAYYDEEPVGYCYYGEFYPLN